MKLSPGEKLILFMLADLHEHLKVESEIDPAFVKDAIAAGKPWALQSKYAGILDDHDTDEAVLQETHAVLTMWRALKGSYEQLSAPDQARVKEAAHSPNGPEFEGFDGNSGYGHLGTAHFMTEKMGWYEEELAPVPNSLPARRSMSTAECSRSSKAPSRTGTSAA